MLRRPSFSFSVSCCCHSSFSSLPTKTATNFSAAAVSATALRSFPVSPMHPSFSRQRLVRSPADRPSITKHRPKMDRDDTTDRWTVPDLPKSKIGAAVELMLYEAAVEAGNLNDPPWVPLAVLNRKLPSALLAEMDDRPELEHGLRSLIEMELLRSCNVRFDSIAKRWVAQKKAMAESLVVIADELNKTVLSCSERILSVQLVSFKMNDEVRRLAESRYGTVAKAVQRVVDNVPGLAFTLKRHARLASVELAVLPRYHHLLPKRQARVPDEATEPGDLWDRGGTGATFSSSCSNRKSATGGEGGGAEGADDAEADDEDHDSSPYEQSLQSLDDVVDFSKMVQSKGEARMEEVSDSIKTQLYDMLRELHQQKRDKNLVTEKQASDKAAANGGKKIRDDDDNHNDGKKDAAAAAAADSSRAAVGGHGQFPDGQIDQAPNTAADRGFSLLHNDPSGNTFADPHKKMIDSMESTQHGYKSQIDVRRLVPYLPTFFVPIEEVLADESLKQAGYTAEHLEEYFAKWGGQYGPDRVTGIEIVTINSSVGIDENTVEPGMTGAAPRTRPRKFIRLHGNNGEYEMTDSLMTDNRLFRFYTRAYSLAPFLKLLPAPGRWVPLQTLFALSKAPSDIAKLAFQREESVLCFAQNQQWFLFTPQNGGAVARKPMPGDAEFERIGGWTGLPSLDCSTTPLPLVFNEVYRVTGKALGSQPMVPIVDIETLFPRAVLQNLWQNFNPNGPRRPVPGKFQVPNADTATWANWAAAHHAHFIFDAKAGTIGRRDRMREHAVRASGDLEEEIKFVLDRQSQHPRRLQSVRRRIAMQRTPNHKFKDPNVLALAIYNQLPEDRHVLVRFLPHGLTNDMRDFLPSKGIFKFLMRYQGRLFNTFDIKSLDGRNYTYVCRANVIPPPNAITGAQTFTNRDVVREIVEICQRASQAIDAEDRTLSDLLRLLPSSLRHQDVVSRGWHIAVLLEKLPECFVLKHSTGGSVRVKLLRPPTEEEYEKMDAQTPTDRSRVDLNPTYQHTVRQPRQYGP